jgi:hypothetical protein
MGWERGPNGYPTTDESTTQSGNGRYNNFQNGTIIWKNGEDSAYSVYGDIYAKWGSAGWDKGELGYPSTDESIAPCCDGKYNHFEHGSIYWTPATGAHIVKGMIRNKWASMGWEKSRLQYPMTDELILEGTNNEGRYQNFQGGVIKWTPNTGATAEAGAVEWITIAPDNPLGTDKVKVVICELKISNRGDWSFHAKLKDTSTLYGDSYALGFVFDGVGIAYKESGSLGAHGDDAIDEWWRSGSHPWFRECWGRAKNTRVTFHLKVKGSILEALKELGKLLSAAGALYLLITGGSAPDEPDNPS